MDSTEIDCIGKFDFTKGFSRFHVVWRLKQVSKSMSSPVFETTISNSGRTISLTWNLGISDDEDGSSWFGLYLKTSDKMVPVVYRISLSSPVTKKPFINCSFFHLLDNTEGWGIPKSAEEMATFPVGEVIFQCWIDIPNTVVMESNNRKRKREASESSSDTSTRLEFSKRNIDLFTTDIAKKFSGVANYEDCCSDITLAITKGGQVIRRFPCHRIILSARSTVFERLFARREWKENAKDGERLIEIKDVDEPTMEIVLNHIYTAYLPDISATVSQLSDVIYAADKYNLSSLKNWCVLLLIGGVQGEVWERIQQLKLADRHSLDQLKAICVTELSMNIEVWESQEDRDGIPPHLLSEIITELKERQYETKEIALDSG